MADDANPTPDDQPTPDQPAEAPAEQVSSETVAPETQDETKPFEVAVAETKPEVEAPQNTEDKPTPVPLNKNDVLPEHHIEPKHDSMGLAIGIAIIVAIVLSLLGILAYQNSDVTTEVEPTEVNTLDNAIKDLPSDSELDAEIDSLDASLTELDAELDAIEGTPIQ